MPFKWDTQLEASPCAAHTAVSHFPSLQCKHSPKTEITQLLALKSIPRFIWECLNNQLMNVNPVLKVSICHCKYQANSVHHSAFITPHKPLRSSFSLNFTFLLPTWCRELLSFLYLTCITVHTEPSPESKYSKD